MTDEEVTTTYWKAWRSVAEQARPPGRKRRQAGWKDAAHLAGLRAVLDAAGALLRPSTSEGHLAAREPT